MIDLARHQHGSELYNAINKACRQFSSSEALIVPGQAPLSFTQLARQVNEILNTCRQSGLSPGDRVGVLLPQGPENGVICLALMLNYGCVPLNPAGTATELQAQIARLDLAALVTVEEWIPDCSLAVVTVSVDESHRAGESRLAIRAKLATNNGPRGDESSPLVLQTSGSTAEPKVVPLSGDNLLASANNLMRSLALTPSDRCLNMMPQFHIGALLDLMIAPLLAGGSVIMCRDMSAATFFAVLREMQPTWYQGVPTMLADLLQYGDRHGIAPENNTLRFCRAVSAPLPVETLERLQVYLNVPVVEIYGMTETAGVITSNSLQVTERRTGSVGKSAGPEVAVIDAAGNAAGPGVKGEVIVRGDNVFEGYESANGQIHRGDDFIGDWFRTGDEGYLGTEGNLYLCGRLKDVINRGGEKISPLEVDRALLAHPDVEDAACFAVAHHSLGEDIFVAVVSRDSRLDVDTLRAHLRNGLAEYKVPRRVLLVDSIPRTSGGKLQRHLLASQLARTAGESEAPARNQPETDIGKLIARLWRELLSVPTVYCDDDFFELGGDSLKAVSFLTELEQHLGEALEPGLLFDHPTLGELEARLQTEGLEDVEGGLGSLYLPEPLFQKLLQLMSGWPGQRSQSRSLIIGHNTLGQLPPLFWCSSDKENYSGLARELGPEQPVYGMRSLFPLTERSPRNNQLLARHLLDELKAIQPEGPYFLGGYCEGGKIVREVSRLLIERGDEVALLYLAEHHVQEPYAGRVAMLLTTSGEWSPLVLYPRPERGWAKVLSEDPSLKVVNLRHREFNMPAGLREVASHLAVELEAARTGAPLPFTYPLVRVADPQILPSDACRADLDGALPPWQAPGRRLVIDVSVTNAGNHTWQSYERSGLMLTARWRRNHTDRVKIWQAGDVPLPAALAPGESLTLELNVEVPAKWGGWTLEVDMCDEGLCYFANHGSTILKLPVMAVPYLGWLNRWLPDNNESGERRAL